MQRIKQEEPLSRQMQRRVSAKVKRETEDKGNFKTVISTGSTLLDLAISGGRIRGGGLPGGIFVEIFGPESSGKTVLLCQIAGNVQKQGGEIKFSDPEGRLDQQFATMFGFRIKEEDYSQPDKVPEIFEPVNSWKPTNPDVINGLFADSLAALSTELEMENENGDTMGMRRAKEFSEALRKACRKIAQKNYLMVCSNQIRETPDAKFGPKTHSPGGKALGFYSSLRLRIKQTSDLNETITVGKKEVKNTYGVKTEVEVAKSSIWKPKHIAWIIIDYDYGIDDIQANLQFLKDYTTAKQYNIGERVLSNAMDKAIQIVERESLEVELRETVINLWEDIEQRFKVERKPRHAKE